MYRIDSLGQCSCQHTGTTATVTLQYVVQRDKVDGREHDSAADRPSSSTDGAHMGVLLLQTPLPDAMLVSRRMRRYDMGLCVSRLV